MLGVSQLPSLAVVTTLLFIGMLCLGMGNGAVFQLVPKRFQEEIGMITGIVGAAGGVGGFFVPNILGTLKEITGSYGTGFLVYTGIGIVALIVLFIAQMSWRKTWSPTKASFKN
jgi:NNP family nitrate/nitrite transporter-like MFS transporter